MPAGRPSDLTSSRQARLELRLHEDERAAIEAAALATGLTPAEWMRAVALAATGRSDLFDQLRRIEPTLRERADAWRRERLPAIARGRGTPFWQRHPEGRHNASIGEMVSTTIVYPHALVVHLVPQRLPWRTQEMWPPARNVAAVDVDEAVAQARRGERNLREDRKELEARRAAVLDGLLSLEREPRAKAAHLAHEGLQLEAVLVRDGMSDRDNTLPRIYAALRRNGAIESAFDLQVHDDAIDMAIFQDLPDHLAAQLRMLDALGCDGPFALAISLIGAEGLLVRGPPARANGSYQAGYFDQDTVFAPTIELQAFDVDLKAALQRPLDALWQSVGLERCHLLELPRP